MKKTRRGFEHGSKLQLNRETVRQLDAKVLEQIRGGEVHDTIVRPSDACGTPTRGQVPPSST